MMEYKQFQEEDPDVDIQRRGSHSASTTLNNYPVSDGGGGGGGGKVRLRAVETESEFFLKFLNVTILRWLVLIQTASSGLIMLSQILLYATVTGHFYKPVDYVGIGLWGPIFFFSVAAGLSYLATKSPSGCLVGTAMGFQVASLCIGGILLIFSIISLVMHGRYNYSDNSYDAEVPGRVFCSFMVLCTGAVMVTAIFISVHFCRAVCCGRQRIIESVLFDVETVK